MPFSTFPSSMSSCPNFQSFSAQDPCTSVQTIVSLGPSQSPKVQSGPSAWPPAAGREGLSTGSTDSAGPGQRAQDFGIIEAWVQILCLPLRGFMNLVMFLSLSHLQFVDNAICYNNEVMYIKQPPYTRCSVMFGFVISFSILNGSLNIWEKESISRKQKIHKN